MRITEHMTCWLFSLLRAGWTYEHDSFLLQVRSDVRVHPERQPDWFHRLMGIRGYVGHHRQREMFLCDQSALFAECPVHKHHGLGFLFACLFVVGFLFVCLFWSSLALFPTSSSHFVYVWLHNRFVFQTSVLLRQSQLFKKEIMRLLNFNMDGYLNDVSGDILNVEQIVIYLNPQKMFFYTGFSITWWQTSSHMI